MPVPNIERCDAPAMLKPETTHCGSILGTLLGYLITLTDKVPEGIYFELYYYIYIARNKPMNKLVSVLLLLFTLKNLWLNQKIIGCIRSIISHVAKHIKNIQTTDRSHIYTQHNTIKNLTCQGNMYTT